MKRSAAQLNPLKDQKVRSSSSRVDKTVTEGNYNQLEQDFWMSILLDVGIGLEINVLTSKLILLGYQMLGEMGCHPEICFYSYCRYCNIGFYGFIGV